MLQWEGIYWRVTQSSCFWFNPTSSPVTSPSRSLLLIARTHPINASRMDWVSIKTTRLFFQYSSILFHQLHSKHGRLPGTLQHHWIGDSNSKTYQKTVYSMSYQFLWMRGPSMLSVYCFWQSGLAISSYLLVCYGCALPSK